MNQTHESPAVLDAAAQTGLHYLPGFGNQHVTEAVAGALPEGRNSPQQAPLGLYAEQISGTAFTAPRSRNRRTWVYRLRPSAAHPSFTPIDSGNLRGAPIRDCPLDPNRLRWDPMPLPERSARTAKSTPRPASRSTSTPRRRP